MANERTFTMVNDQSGAEERATLETMPDFQARGFRLLNVGGYEAALQERRDAEEAARREAVPPLPDHNADRVMADAILIARRTYPDVEVNDPASSNIDPGEDTALTGTTRVAPGSDEIDYDTATIQEMRDYAAANNIDVSGAKLRQDYVDALQAAEAGDAADSDNS